MPTPTPSPSSSPSAPSHTPGPWRVMPPDEACNPFIVADAAGLSVADCACFHEEREANASLIAAAPDGYRLADFIKRKAQIEELSGGDEVTFDPADAAVILNLAESLLAKATGAA